MIASNLLNHMAAWWNSLTGQGSTGDHGGSAQVVARPDKSPAEISELLAHSALMRIVCAAFAEDIVRAWRVHTASANKMLTIEEAFDFRDVAEKALFFAEGYGGAFVLARYASTVVSQARLAEPMGSIRDGLLGFEVFAQHQLRVAPLTETMRQPNGLPMYYTIEGRPQVRIHHSWVHPVKGAIKVPSCWQTNGLVNGIVQLGQSRVDIIYDDFARMIAGYSALSHILVKGNIDILKIKGLAEALSRCDTTEEMQKALEKLVFQASATVTGANTFQPIVIDADEELDRKGGNHAGAADMVRELKTMFAAASRMPVTKLFGEQAKGLGNGGEADLTNYYDGCASFRERRATSLLNWMDKIAAPSVRTKWDYAPLWQMSEQAQAEVDAKQADTDMKYSTVPGVMEGVFKKLKASGRYELAEVMPKEETKCPD